MKYTIILLLFFPGLVSAQEQQHDDNAMQTLFIAEHFESRIHDGNSSFSWEAQGWMGKDLEKLWFKTEGEGYSWKDDDGSDGNASSDEGSGEVQFLYSKAIHPFWDMQAGLRHDFRRGKDRSHLAFGIQGLAPYWFELDMAGFISEKGKVSTRIEAEYELYFTQRLILQPRAELNYAFSADQDIGVGKGLNEFNLGFRLRYEFSRSFAPYVGLHWNKAYGETSDWLNLSSEKDEEFSAVFGIRFWY